MRKLIPTVKWNVYNKRQLEIYRDLDKLTKKIECAKEYEENGITVKVYKDQR